MSTKHTPGAWAVDELSDPNFDFIVRYPETGYVVARVRAPANAHLIAAAPEMLGALTWIRDNCTGLPAVARALADKAIAKAEGKC